MHTNHSSRRKSLTQRSGFGRTSFKGVRRSVIWSALRMESMMKHFIKSMSKEDKQKMMQEFMNSMTEEERAEMIQLMMPIMMKDMKPGTMMAAMIKDFGENDCKKMMMQMPSEMREKCKKMMTACLKACEEP